MKLFINIPCNFVETNYLCKTFLNNKKRKMKFLKLTYAGKSSPTLVNMDDVRTMYVVSDPSGRYEPSTKIQFKNGEYINVSEDLQSILKLTQDFHSGNFQDTDWETVPTVQQRVESSYNRKRTFFPRERNFNNEDAINENRW
jgi:hypothetical protein